MTLFLPWQISCRLVALWGYGRVMSCIFRGQGDSVAMGRLIKSVFAGAESVPEPVRNIPLNKVSFITENGLGLINDRLASAEEYNFLTLQSISTEPFSFYTYRFQTILNSEDLSVYCQLPRLEAPGYYVDSYVRFDVADRRKGANFSIGKVVYDGNVLAQGDYVIDINALTRHCLIIGLTGGGKTNTAKHLLTTLWAKHNIPFIVIESAKREYWELARIQEWTGSLFLHSVMKIKTLLNTESILERIGDIPLQTHIDYLLAAFKASFDLFPLALCSGNMCLRYMKTEDGTFSAIPTSGAAITPCSRIYIIRLT